MSDEETRQLTRVAFHGDTEAQARALAARVRSESSGLLVTCGKRCGACGTAPKLADIVCALCHGTGRKIMPWEGPQGRLALAAYCGHEGARALLDDQRMYCGCYAPKGTQPPCLHSYLEPWVRALSRWPPCVLTRAAVAVSRAVLPEWEVLNVCTIGLRIQINPHCSGKAHAPRRAIEAAETWLADPTEANREEAIRVLCEDTRSGDVGPDWVWRALLACLGRPEQARPAIQSAAREIDEPTIRTAICASLVAWVLA